MRFASIIVPILLPVLFWAAYHYYKDRHQPEPIQNLVLCFLLGLAASYLGKYMYVALELIDLRLDPYELAATNLWQLLGYSVFVIGGIEETAKLVPFLIFAIRFKAFDENLDGIIYASFIALGYAAMENLHYLEFLTQREAIYRGFAGSLVHIMFASIWGYKIGIAKLAGRPIALVSFAAVTLAAVLHGLYDFIVIALPIDALPLSAGLILAVWIWRLLTIRRMKRLAGHIE
jgi:RsiW-degrading membrane proteinase PrsW (M82 family)